MVPYEKILAKANNNEKIKFFAWHPMLIYIVWVHVVHFVSTYKSKRYTLTLDKSLERKEWLERWSQNEVHIFDMSSDCIT